MKKVSFFLALAVMVGLASCTAQSSKVELKSEVDSLSYAVSISNANGLKNYLNRMEIDSLYLNDFIKGLKEAARSEGKAKEAYMLGIGIGNQLLGERTIENINKSLFADDSTKTVNKELMLIALIHAVEGNDSTMTGMFAQGYVQTAAQAAQRKALEAKYADEIVAGKKFLEENAKKPGVVTLENGLQYKVITEGKGAVPTETDKVKVNYRGTLIDGTEFDSSYKRNEPFETRVRGGIIKGWSEVLKLMPVGSKWEVYIPYDLAYGERGSGSSIKPFSTLVFEIELLSIEKK